MPVGRVLRAAGLALLGALLVASDAARALTIVRDAEIEEHVRAIADPILVAAGLVPEAVDLYLVKDDRLNAFVAGGQNLFLHTGLLVRAGTPEQLAGVIAHEAGHIAGGHLTRQLVARDRALGQMLIGAVLGLAAAAAGAPQLGTAILAGGATVAQSGVLAFSRGQEQAADQAAVGYLAELKLPPRGLIEFFEVLDTQDLRIAGEGSVWRRTHPLTRDRVAFLESQDAASPWRGRTLGPARAQAHERARGKLDGFLGDPARVLERWSADGVPGRIARAAALHRRGELDGALDLARGLVAERPKDAFLHELLGQILFENGRIEAAVPPYRAALALRPDAALIRLGLARALLELPGGGGTEEAAALAREVTRATPRDAGAFKTLGIAEGRLGRLGPASLALAEAAVLVGNRRDAELHLGRARQQIRADDPAWLRLQDLAREAETLPEPRAEEPPRRRR
jgi:predicted Zn-dependent protease